MEVYWFLIMDPRKTCVSVIISGERFLMDTDYISGLWEKRHLVRFSLSISDRNSFFSSSSVIQDIMAE